MRNAHEVIRGGMANIDAALSLLHNTTEERQRTIAYIRQEWYKLTRFMDLHMRMEEGDETQHALGMFRYVFVMLHSMDVNCEPFLFFFQCTFCSFDSYALILISLSFSLVLDSLLDREFDGIATEQGLSTDHETLHSLEEAVSAVLSSSSNVNIDQLRAVWQTFAVENERHLQKEESIMMPKVMALKKAGHVLPDLMTQDVLGAIRSSRRPMDDDDGGETKEMETKSAQKDDDDMEFFIKYANVVLEQHAEGKPRARVFDHALWAVSTPDEWKHYNQWIQESTSPKLYQSIRMAIEG
jgi:hypothetical protein